MRVKVHICNAHQRKYSTMKHVSMETLLGTYFIAGFIQIKLTKISNIRTLFNLVYTRFWFIQGQFRQISLYMNFNNICTIDKF